MSPISATNTAASTGPTPGICWIAPVAGIGAQPAGDQLGEQVDLEVQRGDHPQQRVDPGPGLRSPAGRGSASSCCPATPNRSLIGTCTPACGEHGVDLALQARAQPDQLGPVPHPAAQLPGRRWGDPRLGQPAHPQQIGQIRGVALVVLHPPVARTSSPPAGAPDAPWRRARPACPRPSTSRRWPPAPPPVPPRRGPSPAAGTPGRWRSAPSPTARRSRSSAPTPTGADADPSRRSACPAYASLTGASSNRWT